MGLLHLTSDSGSPRPLIPHSRYTFHINILARTVFFAPGKLINKVRALGGLGSGKGGQEGVRFGPEPLAPDSSRFSAHYSQRRWEGRAAWS